MAEPPKKQHVSVVIAGHVDSGKCFSKDTEILMFDGSIKKVQHIKKGDKVMSDNSKPSTVKLTTTGFDEMFDIIPTRGNKYTVTADHVLVLKSSISSDIFWDETRKGFRVTWVENFLSKEKIFFVDQFGSKERASVYANRFVNYEVQKFPGFIECGKTVEIKAKEFYALPKKIQNIYKGFSVGIDYQHRNLDIDPYLLGYWLGNRHTNSTRISLENDQIKEYLEKAAQNSGLKLLQISEFSFDITPETNFGQNSWRNFLETNNLLVNKHIPDDYKFNSEKNRLKLLAGLIHSEGDDNIEDTFDFCLKSEKLTDDIIFLARSLGFHVDGKNKVIRTFTNSQNDSKDGEYFRFYICGEYLEKILFIAEEQNEKSNRIVNTNDQRIKIEPVGKMEYFGFELEENPRFLLSDFTVTHNSTTTGHLIFELGGITQREMDKLKLEADRLGKGSFCFAFYMDNQKEERERGITINCTTKEFFTDRYHYTIIDAPGHRDFIKNMVSGASQADVGFLLTPSDGNFTTSVAKGDRKTGEVKGQTREHARLLNLLGVKQLVVGINKMDSDIAGYKQERFEEVKAETKDMLLKVGWNKKFVEESVAFLPISGWKGDNLLKKSDNMPWWKGVDVKTIMGNNVHIETLCEALDKYVETPARKTDAPLRVPISGVYNIKGVGSVLTGRVEQGLVKPGDEVIFLPTHTGANDCSGKVFTIEMHHQSVPFAGPGDNVGFNIKFKNKDLLPKVGDIMILKNDNSLKVCRSFTTTVQVLDHPGALEVGYSPIALIRTSRSSCKITKINWKQGKETGGKKVDNPVNIKANELCEIQWTPMQPFVVEPFEKCEGLARVAFLDGGSAVMLGRITSVEF